MRELAMQEVKLVSGGAGNNTEQLLASSLRAGLKAVDFATDLKVDQALHFTAKAVTFAARAASVA